MKKRKVEFHRGTPEEQKALSGAYYLAIQQRAEDRHLVDLLVYECAGYMGTIDPARVVSCLSVNGRIAIIQGRTRRRGGGG